MHEDFRRFYLGITALNMADASAGRGPGELLGELLRRHEAEVVVVVAFPCARSLLGVLAQETGESRSAALATLMGAFRSAPKIFDRRAWEVLPRLLLLAPPPPPDPQIAPGDLIQALGIICGCATIRLAGVRKNHPFASPRGDADER
ncbi:hypothetical protein [Actinomadura violacea]|uniref:Uncharacterized protein n=1 Tax=Actinomadura violacea TaxID=2819934 RepID=A0ABS3RXP1_9ACTN|nr:hypothetical protein [Actinomadura violacea]MBO2461531.1 hypothetical protein [Actinomadura violacea]